MPGTVKISLRVYRAGFGCWLWEYIEEGSIVVTRMEYGAGYLTENRALRKAFKVMRQEYKGKSFIVNMVQDE